MRSNTLSPNRETLAASWVDVGPYGDVEDWEGQIEIEILGTCTLPHSLQKAIAIQLANREVENWLEVSRWECADRGWGFALIPVEWSEVKS